ncbi:unnamed protein product, partial [Didymodactylos carnosus]
NTFTLNTRLLKNNYGRWYIQVLFTLIYPKTATSINGKNIQSFYLKNATIQIPSPTISSINDDSDRKVILKHTHYRLIKLLLIILLILIFILCILISIIIYHREKQKINSKTQTKYCITKQHYDFPSLEQDNNDDQNINDVMIEKFQTGDLTTKVILLNHRAKTSLMEIGTDV